VVVDLPQGVAVPTVDPHRILAAAPTPHPALTLSPMSYHETEASSARVQMRQPLALKTNN